MSADGGKTWTPADLTKPPTNSSGRAWAKTLYSATLPLPASVAESGGRLELVCKATDESYNTQPESARDVWNVRGLVNNAWHRVTVNSVKE